MRLDMLLEREHFAEVFSTTLSSYLRNRFDWKGGVAWGKSCDSACKLLVNPKLNLIFPAGFDTDALRGLSAEYSYHPNWLRRFFQRAYVHFTVSRTLRRIFSSACINISHWPEEVSDWCILPGNHSIRIVDMFHNECVVLRKVGFNPQLMNSLIRLRQEFPDLPGPRLLEANLQQGWYREQRISGLPLNRIYDADDMTKTLRAARSAMTGLYRRTLRHEPVSVWLDDRLHQIVTLASRLPSIYSRELRVAVVDCARSLVKQMHLQFSDTVGSSVLTAQTHGDFQPANIFMPSSESSEALYLIDWEYSGRRCVWYDALVFDLRSRFPAGLCCRIQDWLHNDAQQYETLAWCAGAAAGWSAESYIGAFLIDDLLLRLTDTTIPGLRKPDPGFLSFLNEISGLKWAKV